MDRYNDLPERFDKIIEKVDVINKTLQNFADESIKKWDEQAKFNERLFDELDNLEKTAEKTVEKLTTIDERLRHL
jgi:predicted  nucleic acid-binding Zn-ribbon protein